jgi:K(+)-stimulated pyrophosphate-energized sodium pump
VIADAVGDNVGDVAGMAADLFETYAVTIIGAMLLGAFPVFNAQRVTYPLLLGAVAIFATIVGTFFVRIRKTGSPTSAILQGIAVTVAVSIAGFYILTVYTGMGMGIFYTTIVGVVIVVLLALLTDYYTSYEHSPVRKVAEASQAGPGINIISGLANAMESTILPILVICGGVIAAYFLAGGGVVGFYGVAIAAMSMLSVAGIIVSVDAYGPIVDNAGGIAEMAELSPEVREVTDALDAVGNTTKALTKVFAIGSAGLAALSLLFAYVLEVAKFGGGISLDNPVINIMDARVLVGLLLGGGITFIFSSLCLKGVGKGAFRMVEEVRRQFREIAGIMEGKAKPNYGRCVDISVRTALRGMALPGLLAVLSPILVGFILGAEALGGLLIGAIVTGLALALFMANGGGAWDNAKKYVETGKLGGKRSPTHAATVIGDTVGDPFKDTAGPAINPMIKAINMLSVIFAPLIVAAPLLLVL